ncbi:MAG: type II secretion system protein GspN [Deltaproteobacteria bacterium GWA2_38_16]|nr:MAG: type II secretion system protein GspN [Deltaproteobacteria bacterium GWA2_38_16]OGQ03892.1 MAG: type II secretion system protein GspN [Deltaproteobacteria bacterium RIFCSPHIGHO2_02_FULL_38_15]OGQ30130.1 MAG: type II secretion system protein GspN [Deltaproteobacteria bacterium RIFCSPLOWO2_01_FULL_38_9]OGQ59955.1 MAG: type II secretion system protein GspN [Deltaproteobacteria bacterium RIFCSPLOWO2_12_FULL_38_8]HBQ20938.1 type II secretion system protein GspN [Deltaproteobacteria bacterium
MNTQKIMRYSGYVAFGIFIFVFSTYLNFPYGKLKDKFFIQLEKATGIMIDATEFKTTLTLGVKLTGVELSHKSLNTPPLRIPEMTAGPSLLSLITFKPKVKFSVELPQGSLKGFMHYKGMQSQAFDLTLESVNLVRNFKDFLPADINGTIDAHVGLAGNLQTMNLTEGDANINIQQFKVDKLSVMNMAIPQISLSHITLKGNMKKDRFVVEKFDLGGEKEDLYANVTGDIQLNSRSLNQSRLNLVLKFKLSEKMKKEFGMFLPFIANALDSSGFYSLNITGTLAAPMALPKKS